MGRIHKTFFKYSVAIFFLQAETALQLFICGKILEFDKYEIDLFENSGVISITINNGYIPNEQKTDHFVVTVYNIVLPWALNEPFPKPISTKKKIFDKIKATFSKK